ncbi:MAG: hypothetical protein ACRDBM_05440 [Sporomusa sp.]
MVYSRADAEVSGEPDVVTIRAISAPISTALRGEENTRAWENIRLKNIAGDMADRAEMDLKYLAAYNPHIKRQDQTEQSDLAFLQELCNRAGLSLKATNDTLSLMKKRWKRLTLSLQ